MKFRKSQKGTTITTTTMMIIAFWWHEGVKIPPIQLERSLTQGREFRRPSNLKVEGTKAEKEASVVASAGGADPAKEPFGG